MLFQGPKSLGCSAAKPSAAPIPTQRVLKLLPQRGLSVITHGTQMSVNDFKNGVTVEIDGTPFRVTEFLHVKPGKGAAFVRTKMKNLLNGSTQEKTFRGGENVNLADVSRREGQFTYAEGDSFVFMDMQSYEETRLPRDDWAKYLKEGAVCSLMFFQGKVISVEPPNFVELEVTDTPPGVKGNTASGGGSKVAKLETGATISVPLFINTGEVIKIDTRTDQYLSRADK